MASKLVITFFLLISFLGLVSPCDASLTPIASAVEVLSDSGYFSMGITLKLAIKDLSLEDWQEITVFAPSDLAVSKFGQPSLLDLKQQLSPARFPGETLRSLPRGANIPTMRPNSSLIVTDSSPSGGELSINNVTVQDFPVFDDGYVVIYGADEFFTAPTTSDSSLNSSSISSPESIPIPSSATRTAASLRPANCFNIFESATSLLISRGFLIMATFLALQLETCENDTKLTVFAPIDEAIPNPTSKFSDYVTIFRGHVIQRLLSWTDPQKFVADEGSVLHTVLKGFDIELSWSGDILLLNGVPLIYPDLYVNQWIAVHGLNQMMENQAKIGDPFSELNDGKQGDDTKHEDYSSQLGH